MRSPEPASAPIVANLRVSGSGRALVPKELASGVDALYLSGNGYLSKGFLARLEEERMFADRASRPVPFELGDLVLGLAPHGWGKYRFCLDHGTGRIGFTASRRLPTVRIQPRAEFLHAAGPEGTVRHFAEILRPFVEGLVLSVARLDLFLDVEGMDLCAADRSAFVCRADEIRTYETGQVVTGFSFGSRQKQRISARLYDKTAEITARGTDWWELIWGERHTPGAQVWRIEFEIGRAALADLELFRPDAVLAAAPSLWRYCTADGSRCARRRRTPTAPAGRSTLGGRPSSRRRSPTAGPSCASSASASGPRRSAGSCPCSSATWWRLPSGPARPTCRTPSRHCRSAWATTRSSAG